MTWSHGSRAYSLVLLHQHRGISRMEDAPVFCFMKSFINEPERVRSTCTYRLSDQ